ncbi:UPF0158 family protein [Archangium sp.]|uniref:UPF0158 family protein n=1 Tax=Archangium sp. TaxID=1872627 RepID=UPI002D582FB9|nr:UPF0158 family protein [Archangium sp.]HYO55495.1 UPF0158 family protein [Archangium sp.]
MNTSWDEGRIRSLLAQLAPEALQRQGFLLGAQIGLLLKGLDPTFHPKVLGDSTLRSLLARFPDLGAIEPAPSGADFLFRFGTQRANVAPATATMPTDEVTGNQPPWINQELWLGLTQSHAGERRYIDLQTRKVIKVAFNEKGEPGPPVQDEPERYLAVPTLPVEQLKPVATAFASKMTQPEAREALSRSLDSESWLPTFLGAAEKLGVREDWKAAHRAWVAERAREWLERHHFPANALIRPWRVRPPPVPRRNAPIQVAALPQVAVPTQVAAPTQVAVSGIPRESVRPLVLQAIARMSDEELLNLNIPLRYLVANASGSTTALPVTARPGAEGSS